jgi:hypothetical protein
VGIAFVRNVGTSSSGDSGITNLSVIVPAGGIPAGRLLIVRFGGYNYDSGSVSVADSRGHTYQQDWSQTDSSFGINQVWSTRTITALQAGDSITVTFPSGNDPYAMAVDEFSGAYPSAWLFQVGASNNTTDTLPSATITPAADPPPNALVLGVMISIADPVDGYTEDGDSTGGDTWHTLPQAFGSASPRREMVRASYKIPANTSVAQTWNPVLGANRWTLSVLLIYRGSADVASTDRPAGSRAGAPTEQLDIVVFGPKTLDTDVAHGLRTGDPAAAIGNTVTSGTPAGALTGDPAPAIGNTVHDKPCGARVGASAEQLVIEVILSTDRPEGARSGEPLAAIGNTVTSDVPASSRTGGTESTLTGNGPLPQPPSTLNDELPNPLRPIVMISADFTQGPPGRLTNTDPQLSLNSPARRNVVRKFSVNRGRQYELDQVQAGTATLDITDPLEALNPQNPASPYMTGANRIKPYRRMRIQALWPTAGNIINADVSWYDPSFAFGVGGWTAAGASAVEVSGADSWDGSTSIRINQAAAGAAFGIYNAWDLPPGMRVTFSVYVKPLDGQVQVQVVDGAGAVHTSNVATDMTTWTRIFVTWKVVETLERITIYGSGHAAPRFRADATMLEFGPTPSEYTATGPVPYDLFAGYIERYPLHYDHHGVRGIRPLTAVDALAILSRTEIRQSYDATVLADNPSVYLPLSNSAAPTTSQELGLGTVAELHHHTGTNGSISWGGDTHPDGTPAVVLAQQNAFDPPAPTWADTQYTFIEAINGPVSLDLTNGATIEFWAKVPSGVVELGGVGVFQPGDSTVYPGYVQPLRPYINVHVDGGQLKFFYSPTGAAEYAHSTVWPDGEWHHFAIGFSDNGWYLYLDGEFLNVFAVTAPATNFGANVIAHFSAVTGFGDPQSQVSFGRWAFYARQLLSFELRPHYLRGVGYKGELSGARVDRILTEYWGGEFSTQPGHAEMSADHDINGRMVLDVLQEIQETERGLLFATKEGAVIFEDREGRYRDQVSQYTFGEDAAAGELAYVDYAGDFDPTYVFSQANLSRPDNSEFPPVTNPAVQADYGQRILSHTMQVDSDFQLREAATFFLGRYAETRVRIEKLVLDPVTNPALWPVVLGLDISTRVTVKRRAGGLVTTGDYYVEQVNHDVDAEAGTWRVELQMSPVFVPSAWVLGDSDLGVLGTTTSPIY